MSLNLARYDLVCHGRVLATRHKGREVGQLAAQRLAESNLLLSFWGVEVASPSFLDEVVRALRTELLDDEQRWLLAVGFNEDVKDSLALVLEKRKMTMAALDGESIELIGGAQQLEETLRAAQDEGTFTAPQLADRLEMKLPALHARLNALVQAGAISRENDPTARRGKRGLYAAPRAQDVAAAAQPPSVEEVEALVTS